MALKLLILIIFIVLVTVAKMSSTFPQTKSIRSALFAPRSCFDHYKKGSKSNDYYKIYDDNGETFTVYCDMNSEPGSAWTLVESFAFKNSAMSEFTTTPLWSNAPVNGRSPNPNLYRMTLAHMISIRSQSTHWRFTCNFPERPGLLDYIDYVRANFSSFDIVAFSGYGICKPVEYVNIRGHQCAHCFSLWWHTKIYSPHIDSSFTGCQFKPTQGGVQSEDNFGYYGTATNKKFRCTSGSGNTVGSDSTTNLWFGGYQ